MGRRTLLPEIISSNANMVGTLNLEYRVLNADRTTEVYHSLPNGWCT
jgi:hypothetical protein